MGNISRVIGRGQLDHWMIQPVPVWIQMATCGFDGADGFLLLRIQLAVSGLYRRGRLCAG